MGKRVLFTKREIAKYSKTYEGRQYMNKKHKQVGISLIFIAGIAFISFLLMQSNEILRASAFIFLFLSIFSLIFGIAKFLIYRNAYLVEEQEEQIRQAEIRKRIDLLKKANFSQIDNMSGFEFEEFCVILLRELGYNAQQTKKSGDFGADILLEKNNQKIIVQTKRYKQKISVSAVQEITAAQNYYHIYHAWIITNNYFTKAAQELAQANNIRLINRDELAKMINQTPTDIVIPSKQENSVPKAFDSQYDPYKYNSWFCKQILAKKEIAFDFYNQQDFTSIYNVALEAKKLPIKEKQNLFNLHFFYIDIAKWLHSLASYNLESDNFALKICEADFEILPKLEFDRATSFPTATISCIILTRKQEYKKALEYCDFFLQYNLNETSGKSFEGRKLRLQKLISKK